MIEKLKEKLQEKLGEQLFLAILATVCFSVGFGAAHFMRPDNPIEQTAEAILREKYGIDIDLSPEQTNQPIELMSFPEEWSKKK